MVCARCGAALAAGQETCASCGAPVARPESSFGSEDIHRSLAEANLLRIRKRHDEAIGVCTRILRLDPSNATAHSLMGDIYREEGNYQEALGWFKLAVQLNPANQADRKKLDEMIDRVFQGTQQADKESIVFVDDDTPTEGLMSKPGLGRFFRNALEKITPTHIIVGTVIVALITMFTIWIATAPRQANAPVTQQAGTPSTTADAPSSNPSLTPPTAQNPQVTPPAGDAVENPGSGQKLPGLPVIVQPGDNGNTKPAEKTGKVSAPTPGDNKSTTVAKVPPFEPQTQHMSSETLAKETQQLRSALEGALKSSKLQSTLNEVQLDPRDKLVTILYTIPHMSGAVETKQGLLFTGFGLIWAASGVDRSFRGYVLRGYAFEGDAKEPSLAMQADISPQQADAAREAGDYSAVAKCLSKVWWRNDLENAAL